MQIQINMITDDGNDYSEFFDTVEDAVSWMEDKEANDED